MLDKQVLTWRDRWVAHSAHQVPKATLLDLQNYGRLCGLSRRRENPVELKPAELYTIRVNLEKAIMEDVANRKNWLDILFSGSVFGRSSKQGVSFRLGLESCHPSSLCISRCYAHDGRDASPQSVRRGALNSLIAKMWDPGHPGELGRRLERHSKQAVRAAIWDATNSKFRRDPRIRFSHVGDIAAYPDLANWMVSICQLQAIGMRSRRPLVCVTYTRRKEASKLNQNRWQIVFSLDESSVKQRMKWIPTGAITAWAAFDRHVRREYDVNFAEHHGQTRFPAYYRGTDILQQDTAFVCPSTRIGFPHGCDNNKCDKCFRKES